MPFTLWAGKKDAFSGGTEAIVANVTSQTDDRPVGASNGSQRSRRDAANRMQIGSSPVPSVDSSVVTSPSADIEWTPALLTFAGVFLVIVCTFFTWIAVILTATIARVSSEDFLLDLSPTFFVVILMPMATNLGRMQATTTLAKSGKYSEIINLMLETAVQSTYFVLPVMILISWMSQMHMTLDVGAFESAVLFSTALVLNGALRMGESNWLVGAVLLILYVMITVGYWARSSDSLSS